MKLALMVHQFGTPGEERGTSAGDECVVWVLLYTETNPSLSHRPAFSFFLIFLSPRPVGCSCSYTHMVSAEHQERKPSGATP